MASRKATTDRGFSSLVAAHEKICASFLGPKAENHKILHDKFIAIAEQVSLARERFHPNDPTFIDEDIIQSASFIDQVKKLEDYLDLLSQLLAKHCIPFFSPRYNGHMVSDASMPAIVGYILGMLWNQNNVTPEASPITSHVEYLVGQQICRLLGYRSLYDPAPLIFPPPPIAWGHITCDGSVANLESVWVARNLKYYPLSLQLAVKEGLLSFVADTFETTLCNGDKKKLAACSAWELLNLAVNEILDLPSRLVTDYGISTTFIERAVGPYLIANTGKEVLEQRFEIKPAQMMISVANHYSWPKSASITGIGMNNLIHVDVDIAARLNIANLDERLEKCLNEQQAVYAVVSIMGTTEHGAVDPLFDIIQLREKYQKRGLSFYVHVDAAWGGYFCSMIPPIPDVIIPTGPINLPTSDIILEQPLSEYTRNQLFSIRFADSCTVDPHKAGFAPYPAGSLCYRDERLRFMVTMTAAYINTTADVDSIGTYGVEGSKPGAAATSVWLAHHVIGLHYKGYGSLLGEAMYTSVKLYCNWATMTFNEPNLIVKTFVMLPSEQKGLPPSEVDKETQYIIDNIVNKPNSEIVNNKEVMQKISELGGDLIIIVFVCNFHVEGKVNEDVTEANFFNRRLFERFSVTKRQDDPYTRELIVGSTSFDEDTYGVALAKLKERLGLKGGGDLTVMTLVPMSPFPTAHNLVKSFADTFKNAALEEIEECYTRIIASPAQHSFVMQGTDQLFLSSMSVFNIGSYRRQVILAANLPAEVMEAYTKEVEEDPAAFFTLTTEKALLSTILSEKHCKVSIYKGLNTDAPKSIAVDVELSDIQTIINRSIAPKHLDKSYPEFMPFYLYGTPSQQHIDHMLLVAPNTQLSAARVTLRLETPIPPTKGELLTGLIAVADTIREDAMQPFNINHEPTFFTAGREISVTIYSDPNPADTSGPGLLKNLGTPIATGTIIISSSIFVDYTLVNQEHGVALCKEDHTKLSGLPDISRRIDIPSVGERYNITPIDISAVFNQLVSHHPGDKHDRKLSIRTGWRDEFDEELEKRNLDKI